MFEVLLVHAHEAKRAPISFGLVTLCSHSCDVVRTNPIRRPYDVPPKCSGSCSTSAASTQSSTLQNWMRPSTFCACEKLRARKQRVDEDTLPDLRATQANNLSTKAIPNWNKGTTRSRQFPYCHLQWGLSTRSCKRAPRPRPRNRRSGIIDASGSSALPCPGPCRPRNPRCPGIGAETPDPGQIGISVFPIPPIPAKSGFPEFPAKSGIGAKARTFSRSRTTGNWDRENPGYFPGRT